MKYYTYNREPQLMLFAAPSRFEVKAAKNWSAACTCYGDYQNAAALPSDLHIVKISLDKVY